MSFTERYIKVPKVIGKVDDLTESNEGRNVMVSINPMEVVYYHPSSEDDTKNFKLSMTQLCFKGGHWLLINMKTNDFEKLLNSHLKDN